MWALDGARTKNVKKGKEEASPGSNRSNREFNSIRSTDDELESEALGNEPYREVVPFQILPSCGARRLGRMEREPSWKLSEENEDLVLADDLADAIVKMRLQQSVLNPDSATPEWDQAGTRRVAMHNAFLECVQERQVWAQARLLFLGARQADGPLSLLDDSCMYHLMRALVRVHSGK